MRFGHSRGLTCKRNCWSAPDEVLLHSLMVVTSWMGMEENIKWRRKKDFVLHVTKMIINLQYACNDDKNNHWIVIILVQIMLRNISEEHMAVTPIL